ncbi:MAG: Gfo/Idh/MocA family oxidoreductase [Pseudomonadota bacterium]
MERYLAFADPRAFGYLQSEDRLLSARPDVLYNFGFVGCGNMGQEHMFNTLLEGRACVAGIYDAAQRSVDAALANLSRRYPDEAMPKTYASLAQMRDDPTLDALIVSTPNFTHIDVIRSLVGCDKAIFLEKPIATTLEDAVEIYKLLSEHPRYVQIGLQYRYKAVYREALIETFYRRSLGQIFSVNLLEHRFPFLDKVQQWNKFNEKTGGTLVEKCCHYFDLINVFAQGTPRRVFATGQQSVNFRDFSRDNLAANGLDHAQVLIEYDNGVTGNFSLNMFTPGSREELVLCGDKARLHTIESSRLGESNQNEVMLWSQDGYTSRDSIPNYPAHIAKAGHHGSTFFEHVALIDGLRGEQTLDVLPATLDDALWSVLVAFAAQQSIVSGEPVALAGVRPEGLGDRRTDQLINENSF